MKRFVQLDGGKVTGWLDASRMPDLCPEGRTFVEVEEFPEFGSTLVDGAFIPPTPVEFVAQIPLCAEPEIKLASNRKRKKSDATSV